MKPINTPIKVHLFGSEGTGWALDTDIWLTRKSLEAIPQTVLLTSFRDAEVIHSVWEVPLLNTERQRLLGKRVICHVSNNLYSIYEQPCMIDASAVVGMWIAMSSEATAYLRKLNMAHRFVPYAVDYHAFRPLDKKNESIFALRDKYKIPQNKFVISNFMRDSLGVDLNRPKEQKGPDIFLEIVTRLQQRQLPVHILLAGPRRQWLREQLSQANVPYTFIGKKIEGDDNRINILDNETICQLYQISDLHLISSRWEGGPRAVLEAAATRTPIASTPVGLAHDVLDKRCLYNSVDQGIDLVQAQINERMLDPTLDKHLEKILSNHTIERNAEHFRNLYADAAGISDFRPSSDIKNRFKLQKWHRSRDTKLRKTLKTAREFLIRKKCSAKGLCIGLWHTYFKPPYGGGNQFMLALRSALEKLGVRVLINKHSPSIDVHICNSLWFDDQKFKKMSMRNTIKMIHRIDGPIDLYRGVGRGEDERLHRFNAQYAAATVYQSAYCLRETIALGFKPVRPMVIYNAVNDSIFNTNGRHMFSKFKKIRLISSSWSDNPRKGGTFYKWLDEVLDWTRFEYTFVGRTKEHFENIRHVPPQDSESLAMLLKQHDIFISASRHEPCSNALLEALACGLPAFYRNDGGNPELVRFGGVPFEGRDDALSQLDRLVDAYESFQAVVYVKPISEIAQRYLELAHRIVG